MEENIERKYWLSQDNIQKNRAFFCENRNEKIYRKIDFFRGKKILLWTRKPGLGDMYMNALCCFILNQKYGLNVWFGLRNNPSDRNFPILFKDIQYYNYNPNLKKYPLVDNRINRGFEGHIDHCGIYHDFDFIIDFRYYIGLKYNTIFQSLMEFGVNKIVSPINGLKTDYFDNSVEQYDVIMILGSGGWKPVRAYRNGDKLKEKLEDKKLKVFSVNNSDCKKIGLKKIVSMVKKSKVYIGAETGPSHLLSGIAKKSVIIQSGIHLSSFWNIYSNTYIIESEWECSKKKCICRKHEDCKNQNGVCIDRFSPEDISNVVIENL